MKTKILHWHVRPAEGSRWTLETPDGTLVDCVLGSIAIDLGTKLARENRGCVLVYGSDGRIKAAEDFSATHDSLMGVH
jgi:hypothetical protein